MSYYPTERRGGCMESLSRCCRQAYVYPIDARKLLYGGGAILGIILVAVIWSGLSGGSDTPQPAPFTGSDILNTSPLVVGCNFFPSNLRDLAHNNIYQVKFNQNLQNDSVFGSAACKSCQTDLSRLKNGHVASQLWSIKVPCNAKYKDAVALTLEQVDAVSRLISNYNLSHVRFSSEIKIDKDEKRVGSLLAVSSGHSIDGRMAVLRSLYNLGVRVMALTAECNTTWAGSYTDVEDVGLNDFGKAVVLEMNRLGIVIDLSESSHQTQLDVLNITKAPVIFSHAGAFSLMDNKRNVQDDVLKLLKTNEGLVMVTFAEQYLTKNISNPSISDVIAHINYIKNITGAAGVGIGSEFDAANQVYSPQLSDVSTFPTLFDQLGKTCENHDDLKMLAGGNFIRVFQAVEKVATDLKNLPVDETYKLQVNASCYTDFDSRVDSTETTVAPASTTSATIPTPTKPSTTVQPQTTLPTVSTQTTTSNTTTAPSSTTSAKPSH